MICPKCGAEVADGAAFCTTCGAPMVAAEAAAPTPAATPTPDPTPVYAAPVYMDPKDHTAEFDAKDISDNKVFAMLPYIMSVVGVIIALLASKDSPYTLFHVRQALKIQVTGILLSIVTLLLCWTVIVPIAGGIAALVLLVVDIICFFSVCNGKAKEAPIVSSLGFLK